MYSNIESDEYLAWAFENFSGYVATDEVYDGPFCILYLVDNRTYKKLMNGKPYLWLKPQATLDYAAGINFYRTDGIGSVLLRRTTLHSYYTPIFPFLIRSVGV